jgi:hypothetical protein
VREVVVEDKEVVGVLLNWLALVAGLNVCDTLVSLKAMPEYYNTAWGLFFMAFVKHTSQIVGEWSSA